ncbi:kinase phosphorylation protein-domain-containing protein [Auriculariales sp. MPI-PUGE-AT-0066]|nr:kinase phosphorylation protein-domain-containing protein [Auriculariales sp. MPI-PUGE-AT-0066]
MARNARDKCKCNWSSAHATLLPLAMDLYDGPIRGGTRGGAAEFKWTDVGGDKDRENYLGHSINAPTGRWQKNQDVHWYSRDQNDAALARAEEIRRIKAAEADILAIKLGYKAAPKAGEFSSVPVTAIPLPDEPVLPEADVMTDAAQRLVREEKAKRKEEKRVSKDEKRARKEEKRERKERRRAEKDDRYASRHSRSRSPDGAMTAHLLTSAAELRKMIACSASETVTAGGGKTTHDASKLDQFTGVVAPES